MSRKQKIGVLTFHRCINYGSYWQARCLVEGLRARGHDAVILDHQSRRVNAAEWQCALQPTLPTPVPLLDRPRYAFKMLKFSRAFAKLPLSRPFGLEHPEEMEPLDQVVVGSDEVWNLHHPWFGGCRLFWGEGLRTKRLISYAASFGNYHAWDGIEAEWGKRLEAFDAISVRDENAQCLVRAGTGESPEIVLDPCLQFTPRPDERRRLRGPYVAVYGHNFSEPFSQGVQRWAQSRGLRLVSIGYRNAWADAQWITADPHDFAHFMSGAEAVATNFFHGCVFALRNARPFACEVTQYRSTKVMCLMATVGGERHLLPHDAPPDAYAAVLEEPLDPAISQRIEALRRTSNAFLDRALASNLVPVYA